MQKADIPAHRQRGEFMTIVTVDRSTFWQNLQKSRLLSKRKLRLVMEKLRHVREPREMAKALATWRLVTKFQAKMLLLGRTSGLIVGPYCLLDEVGHAGLGRTYKAVHRAMHRLVTLKILSPEAAKSEQGQRLFKREARATAQLNHPNIAMALEFGADGNRRYLALEYVNGPSLEQYVARHGALPIGLACEIIFQAAAGLQHAHEKGLVHRDLKPANLLLGCDAAAGTVQVKIFDFGLARLPRRKPSTDTVRGFAPMPGEADFQAPEQARDVEKADIRSDLCGLGCTFYYLLTGQVPFRAGNLLDLLNRRERAAPTALEELRPEVPPSVAAIVRKLMANHPAARYQTPDELLDALAGHAAPSPIEWPIGAAASAPEYAVTTVEWLHAKRQSGSGTVISA
jgi:serine/threonine-protein kinase